MALIDWNERYSIGIARIDAQHQSLVAMINRLHEAMLKGQGAQTVGPIVNELVAYTRTHFSTEEELFKRHGYPETAGHVKAHAELIEKALDWKRQLDAGNSMLTIQISSALRNWLLQHIEKADRLYAPFLISKGVR